MKAKLHAWYQDVDAQFLRPKDLWRPIYIRPRISRAPGNYIGNRSTFTEIS